MRVPPPRAALARALAIAGPVLAACALSALAIRGGRGRAGPAPALELPLGLLAAALVVTGLGYGMAMLAASRREPGRRPLPAIPAADGGQPGGGLFFVFLLPCLNEEAVIAASLRRLLSLPGDFIIVVIDDGSDDGTADVAAAQAGDRVRLLRRRPPQARQGKGEALNAAVRYLLDGGHLGGRDPDRVIAVVVDADGRMDTGSLRAVAPLFADPAVGAVQIGVRISNRAASTLARMQDMEFVIYTEVFQRGRRHLGSVGLGGNGQFMRLSAMLSLGRSPWTRSLTDDLDLGVRMIAAGWRTDYCPAVAVHQQGVVELRRLIRQRSRWFQGHLQSWGLIPLVLRSAPRRGRADLLYHLTSPALLLIASLLSASFLVSAAGAALRAAGGGDPAGWWLASAYALTFGPALALSTVYWAAERREGIGALRVIALAHAYVCYGMMWYAAGWWAVVRALRGQTGWAKTARVAEAARPAAPPATARRAGPRAAPRRAPRAWRLAAAAAAVGAASLIAAGPADGGSGGNRPWVTVFTGYGTASVAGSGPAAVVSLSPAAATSPASTHAALVVSAAAYRDFTATVRVRTARQLRRGAAGRPHPWEVGWVLWHYTSPGRFYALSLGPSGWVLSKQDPAYRGGQRFLASGRSPAYPVGVPHAVRIAQAGGQITVAADGRVLTRLTDASSPYLSGALGLYTEDAQAVFDQIRLVRLPREGN